MSTEIKIETLEDYLREIAPLSDTTELHYIYRGQKNKTWHVQSSAARRLLKKLQHPDLLSFLFIGYLHQIIDDIELRYARTYIDMKPLECMAHLQHNKVATGLIDFTYNPLVALWVACETDSPEEDEEVFIKQNTQPVRHREEDGEEDGKVFMLDIHSQDITEIRTREEVGKNLDDFFHQGEKWYLWQPTIGNSAIDSDRITIQQSAFMFGMPEVPDKMFCKTIIVPKECKKGLLEELAKVGITEKTLFSDLAGFIERNDSESDYNAELAEHYYTEKIEASGKEDKQLAKHYSQRATFRTALGKYDAAIDDYSKAIKLKPYHASYYNNRGIAYKAEEKYDLAISDYTKAIELKPDHAFPYYNRGIAYKAEKKYDLAISDYTKAIELKPDYASAYYNRGLTYRKQDKNELATKDFNKAAELNPTTYAKTCSRLVNKTK